MTEESLREIIGLAKKSRWIQVKKFIKVVIEKTIKKEAGYYLTALDVSINGKNKSKYNALIKNKENIKEIDKISDFSHLSLYQTTHSSNNLIDLSQINGTIIVLAKYLGPLVEDHEIFDFSVHLDTIDEPFFTIGSGRKINGSEFLEIINKNTKPIIKTKKDILKNKAKQVKDPEIGNVEAFVFEKLTNKKALWSGSETKSFQNWRLKIKNKYRIETGKITYYKEKPTKQFTLYLKNLINKRPIKNKKPIITTKKDILKKKSKQVKDPEIINVEVFVFEKLTNKKAIWSGSETKSFQNWKLKIKNKYRIETGKITYYKEKPTNQFTLYLKNLINKKPIKNKKQIKNLNKNASKSNKQSNEVLEKKVFETLTGKKAIWNESETKNFKNWKSRRYKIYENDTGRNPYYKGNLTQNFKKFLKSLIKNN
ncbi:MAG: hypothetical protein Lokiarch_37200 [Candidatus Lokiarchaeum sp. GC14_75]|nr:MAG: hypothetical protein Lokiarch_37200 [Candidatus Lokiarchaeum sp. GC14_75]